MSKSGPGSVSGSVSGQAVRFLLVGAATFVLDYAAYRGLLAAGVPVSAAKACGFLAGTTAAYAVNRRWTFGAAGGRRPVAAFAALYATTLVLNVAANAVALQALGEARWRVEVAFVLAQALTSTANFVGLRLVVFAPRRRTSTRTSARGQARTARAPSSRATGTRNGEQET